MPRIVGGLVTAILLVEHCDKDHCEIAWAWVA
jgi:hypothetical protein